MKKEQMIPVFVYGTLKRGYRNHRLLTVGYYQGSDQRTVISSLGPATMKGYTLLQIPSGGFPCAVPARGGRVHGELYLVSPDVMRKLDLLEDAPNMYRREAGWTEDGRLAVIYVWNLDVSDLRPVGEEWPLKHATISDN